MIRQRVARPRAAGRPTPRPPRPDMNYNPRRLFVASCLALITSAFSFQMRADSGEDFRTTFNLTQEMVGSVMGGHFFGMAVAMLIFSFLCDFLGMGKVLALAWLCHLLGISG